MKKLSLVMALLFVIESVMTQAPGDGSEICLPGGTFDFLRFTIPENMKVLMDSRDYEFLLGNSGEAVTWQQVDVDGLAGGGTTTIWSQQGDRGCQQIVTVCGFTVGQQNNWLITQHISRQTTTLLPQITVIVEFEFSNCETVMNCARTFSVWKYDNSTVDATLARDTSKYTLVAAIISPEDTTGSVRQNETIVIDFSGSETGFYLAIRDEGSCLLILRVLVFYYVCPGITENLIIHPEILAPPISATSQPINVDGGRCVLNATPTQGSSPILTCSQGGIWSVIVSCMCDPGFSMNADGTACILCSAGNYATDTRCLPCPANSNSTEPTTECPCFQGFYRDPSEGPGGDCALPPSAPVGLTVENRTDTTVSLRWQEPASAGGGSSLEYNLFFQTPGVDSRSLFGTVSETEGLITGLSPFLSYTLSVSSETSVSGEIPEMLFSERSANITVAESQSDLVPITDDGLVSVTGLVITWSIPASTMQFLRTYRLTITDDSSGNTVQDVMTNDTSFDASSLGLTTGTYSVKVCAIVNIDGSGDLPVIVGSGATLNTQANDPEGTSNTAAIIGGILGGGLFGVVVVLLLILVVAKRRRHAKSPVQTSIYDYVSPPELPPRSIVTSPNVSYGSKVEMETNTTFAGSVQVENYQRTDTSSDQSHKNAGGGYDEIQSYERGFASRVSGPTCSRTTAESGDQFEDVTLESSNRSLFVDMTLESSACNGSDTTDEIKLKTTTCRPNSKSQGTAKEETFPSLQFPIETGDDYNQIQSYEKAGGDYDQIQSYEKAGDGYDQIQSYEKAGGDYDQVQSYEKAGDGYDQVQSYEKAGGNYDQIQTYEKVGGGYDQVQSYEKAGDGYEKSGD